MRLSEATETKKFVDDIAIFSGVVRLDIQPVILCGGSGTRLWPVSRAAFPKQFVAGLNGRLSLFQQAARRLSGEGFAPPAILTGEQFRFTAAEQLREVGVVPGALILEPAPRNTAPAVLVASLWAASRDPGAVLLVAPSALAGGVVTFGVWPDRPETGYGYLELDDTHGAVCPPLTCFVEKPEHAEAVRMLAAGNYLWNVGLPVPR